MTPADTLAGWIALVDHRYPFRHAASWDSVGLQVGDPADRVRGVLVCLDVTPATLAEAAEVGADLVLAHHPLFFRPLATLTPATAAGRLTLDAARAGIAVLGVHTNLDVATDGTSAPLVEALGLTDVAPLSPAPTPDARTIVTFVPVEQTDAVVAAMAAAGAGDIGEYTSCSFQVTGRGTFRPSAAADPVVGEREQLNTVAEDRVQMVCPPGRVGAVLAALRAAHPYEEVAVDVVHVDGPAHDRGLGRIGTLPEPLTLAAVGERVAGALGAPGVRVAGDRDRTLRRVAVCGGAGDSLIDTAIDVGAECYVTGDLRHHPTLDALTRGLTLVDAGHFWTEDAALDHVAAVLRADADAAGLAAPVHRSRTCTDPWVSGAAAR